MGLVCPVMKYCYFYTTLKLNPGLQKRNFMKTYKRDPFLRQKTGPENDNFQKVIL